MQVLVWQSWGRINVHRVSDTGKAPTAYTFRKLKKMVEDVVYPWQDEKATAALRKVRTIPQLVECVNTKWEGEDFEVFEVVTVRGS